MRRLPNSIEIDRLTAEIAEKQAELKRLKAQAAPTLTYVSITECLRHDFDHVFIQEITNALRGLCTRCSEVYVRKDQGSRTLLVSVRKNLRVSEMQLQSVQICNEMIAECAPIIVKYIKRFASLDDGEI